MPETRRLDEDQDPGIEVHGLDWAAGGTEILHGIDATFPAGSITGLLGPNGSGKTSLLHLIAGLRRPTAGEIRIGDRSLSALRGGERGRTIALVEQQASTGLDLRVADVVALGRTPHRGRWPSSTEGAAELRTAADAAGIQHLLDRKWATLSGGERQRVHLARALAQVPSVLLLDEPTNHLDLHHQIDFLQTVRSLERTTIAALHDLDLAAAFCDRLVVLQSGRVIAAGPADQVLTADLVREVYRVQATVEQHAAAGRLHVTWSGIV